MSPPEQVLSYAESGLPGPNLLGGYGPFKNLADSGRPADQQNAPITPATTAPMPSTWTEPTPPTAPIEAAPPMVMLTPLRQTYKLYLDKTTVWIKTRWLVEVGLLVLFSLRIVLKQGWFISAYALGIYLLNLFIGFLTPQKDTETDAYILPMGGHESGEYRPFLRKVSEFHFWYQGIIATTAALFTTFFDVFDLPVFWPVLLFYFVFLFALTMKHQIKDMLQHHYVPFSGRKQRYGDVSSEPVRRVAKDMRGD